ncbi:MAG TPA: hypothetical protein VNV16_05295 [Methylibium sp.]|nr:hypothetical protein [Methylibium sp.]
MNPAADPLAHLAEGAWVCLHLGPRLTPWLDTFLGRTVRWRPWLSARGVAAVVGWGLKGVSLQARDAARRAGLPYVALEDGFLRSVGLGDTDAALSLVVDDLGIYYDASAPSRLERLIACERTPAEQARAAALARAWCAGRLSKYNHAPESAPPHAEPHVLVVDQTQGDASIVHGLADAGSFARMLEAALDEHPRRPLLLKVHPDVVAGRKRGHFERLTPGQAARVTLIANDVHAPALLERAAAVYTVTSQMGFEALLWERPLRCFGMPFYAGWGLSDDALAAPARRATAHRVTREALVHAALIDYPRCLDPLTLQRAAPERLVEWMSGQRRRVAQLPPGATPRGWGPPEGGDALPWRTLRALKRWRDRPPARR